MSSLAEEVRLAPTRPHVPWIDRTDIVVVRDSRRNLEQPHYCLPFLSVTKPHRPTNNIDDVMRKFVGHRVVHEGFLIIKEKRTIEINHPRQQAVPTRRSSTEAIFNCGHFNRHAKVILCNLLHVLQPLLHFAFNSFTQFHNCFPIIFKMLSPRGGSSIFNVSNKGSPAVLHRTRCQK